MSEKDKEKLAKSKVVHIRDEALKDPNYGAKAATPEMEHEQEEWRAKKLMQEEKRKEREKHAKELAEAPAKIVAHLESIDINLGRIAEALESYNP